MAGTCSPSVTSRPHDCLHQGARVRQRLPVRARCRSGGRRSGGVGAPALRSPSRRRRRRADSLHSHGAWRDDVAAQRRWKRIGAVRQRAAGPGGAGRARLADRRTADGSRDRRRDDGRAQATGARRRLGCGVPVCGRDGAAHGRGRAPSRCAGRDRHGNRACRRQPAVRRAGSAARRRAVCTGWGRRSNTILPFPIAPMSNSRRSNRRTGCASASGSAASALPSRRAPDRARQRSPPPAMAAHRARST